MATYCVTVGEMPSHNHPIASYTATGGTFLTLLDHENAYDYGWKDNVIKSAGGNQYHNNVSPCVGAYLWHRTA